MLNRSVSRSNAVCLAATALVLVIASVWVPARPASDTSEAWHLVPSELRWAFVWRLKSPGVPHKVPGLSVGEPAIRLVAGRVHWPLLIAEYALMLNLSGLVIRMLRRRRAAG